MIFYSYLIIQGMILLSTFAVHAYPEFIGYGYASCLTCHYNSQGGGPLSDYGRALFSELTARTFISEKALDEDLAEESGFLGKKKLPYWIRPAVKLRTLWNQKNPGSRDMTEKIIPMQFDIYGNFFFNETAASPYSLTPLLPSSLDIIRNTGSAGSGARK